MSSMSEAESLDLPMPASPEMSTTWPSPVLAPDQRGQVGHVQGFKAAFDGTRPQRGPGPRRPGDALEILRSEIPEFEEIAEQLSRAVGDHDHVRLGQRLQARRQVRRVADDATFPRISRSDQV